MMGYTLRDKKEMLGCPLDKKYPSFQGISLVQCEGGYMLADLLQYMLDNQPNRRDTLDFAKMMNRYSVYKGLVKSIRDIFCIDTDPQFVKYFEGFCRQYIDDIETRQYAYRMQQAGDGSRRGGVAGHHDDIGPHSQEDVCDNVGSVLNIFGGFFSVGAVGVV